MIRPKVAGLLVVALFSIGILSAAPPAARFEANLGQTDSRVRYLARTPQGTVFFTDAAVVFKGGEGSSLRFELAGADASAQWEVSREPAKRLLIISAATLGIGPTMSGSMRGSCGAMHTPASTLPGTARINISNMTSLSLRAQMPDAFGSA